MKKHTRKGQRFNYYRPFKGYDLFYDFTGTDGTEYRFTPRTFIDALDDAREAMSYSNWATDKFARIEEIVRRYCEEHNIPLGLSRKQRELLEKRMADSHKRALKAAGSDLTKLMKVLDRYDANRRRPFPGRVALPERSHA